MPQTEVPGTSEHGTEDEGRLVTDGGSETDASESASNAEDGARILHLDLEGLFLDLLGLEVDLNEVVLDVDAVEGSNNLLGNLLSGVAGLLSPPTDLLGEFEMGDLVGDLSSTISDGLRSLVSEVLDELELSPQDVMTGVAKEVVSQTVGSDKSADGAEA